MTTQDKLNNINEAIENSNKSYLERNREDVLLDIKANQERLLNGSQEDLEEFELDMELEYDYSTYIPQANITRHELELDGSDRFQIGNNLPSAE